MNKKILPSILLTPLFTILFNIGLSAQANETIYFGAISHILENKEGTGYVDIEDFFQLACETNMTLKKYDIEFYLSDLKFIEYDEYYAQGTGESGFQLVTNNIVEDAINFFFTGRQLESCGYSRPNHDWLLVSNLCMKPGIYEWAHQIGHIFNIPHTFAGSNFGDLETVDGSNCDTAGDRFCDTPPDYLDESWQCDEDSMSIIELEDPNGVKFHVDGRNIMSYSNCRSIFSHEQAEAMKNNMIEVRELDTSEPIYPEITDFEVKNPKPTLDDEVYYDNITFSWDPIEGAIGYLLEYTPLPNFNDLSNKVFLTEPFYQPETFYAEWTNIQWRVKPYGHRNFCNADFGETRRFSTLVTSIETAKLQEDRTVYPNPAKPGELLNIQSEVGFTSDLIIKIFDSTGKSVREQKFTSSNNSLFSVNINDLLPGVHYVHLISDEGRSSHKVIIMP